MCKCWMYFVYCLAHVNMAFTPGYIAPETQRIRIDVFPYRL